MMKIEAIIDETKVDDVKAALKGLGCDRTVITGVLLNRITSEVKTKYRGCEYTPDLAKIKIELCVSSFRADEVVEEIARAAYTSDDNGMILVYEIADTIAIRGRRRLEF